MVRSAKASTAKIHVHHATAPTCWWSWGYEAAMNRLPLVYGDQVKIHLYRGVVYEDVREYLRQYELTHDSMNRWARESVRTMGVPIRSNYGPNEPASVLPATHAVLAALRQGPARGERFNRAVLRRFVVEGQDVTRPEALREAAEEAGLHVGRFQKDLADTPARETDLDAQRHGIHQLPIGFYNLAVTDGADRMVILDYAFDPSLVEGAIDYLGGGALRKRRPADVLGYLRAHGPAPLREVARVFGLTDSKAAASLRTLQKTGKVAQVKLAGAPHWQAMR